MDYYGPPDHRRTRGAYIAQCTFDYFFTILASDAFFAKLLTHIGVSDAVTGVIASLASFSFLCQLVSLTFADRLRRVKRTVTLIDTCSQFLFMSIFFVPFLPGSVGLKTALVAFLLLAAYSFVYCIAPICYKWGNSFVDPQKRGQYSALKEMISLISGICFSLAVGFAVDRFEAAGKLRGAFLFIAGSMLAVCSCNVCSFLMMEERPVSCAVKKRSLRELLGGTFGCKSYRNAVIMACLWEFSKGITAGFMGTYKTNDLGMRVGTVQIINTASSLGRFAVSRPFGKYSDSHTYAKGYRIALYIAGAGFLFNIFAAPASKWCVAAFSVLYAMSFAGTNQNTYNMTYSYLDEENIVHGIALTDALRGVCGFLASLIGGRILSAVQGGGNRLFGRTVYGQQVLSAISLLLTAVTAAYNKLVVSKQKEYRK